MNKEDEIEVWLAHKEDGPEKSHALTIHQQLLALREAGVWGWVLRRLAGRDVLALRLAALEKAVLDMANQLAAIADYCEVGYDDMETELGFKDELLVTAKKTEVRLTRALEAAREEIISSGVQAHQLQELVRNTERELDRVGAVAAFGQKVMERDWLFDFSAFAEVLVSEKDVPIKELRELLEVQTQMKASTPGNQKKTVLPENGLSAGSEGNN